ncbi:MAG: cytochrome c oxidase subunit 3 [Bryobacteraceae bacterium]
MKNIGAPLTTIAATRTQQAVLIFICADFVMFASFYAAYIYLRHLTPVWPTAFHFPSGLMGVAMTMFLLAGSVLAAVAARQKDEVVIVRCLAAAVVVWLSFIFVEAVEWVRLIMEEGVTFRSNPWNVPVFGASFYLMSGFHVLHVIAGIVYLTVVAVRIRKYDVGACALYVHFVNVMWLILFPTIYLSASDLKGL